MKSAGGVVEWYLGPSCDVWVAPVNFGNDISFRISSHVRVSGSSRMLSTFPFPLQRNIDRYIDQHHSRFSFSFLLQTRHDPSSYMESLHRFCCMQTPSAGAHTTLEAWSHAFLGRGVKMLFAILWLPCHFCSCLDRHFLTVVII